MNTYFKLSLLFGIGFLLVFACEEPTEVGSSIIPDGDALEVDTTETLSVLINVVNDDVIFTDNLSFPILGARQSDVFGNSYAGIYTEVGLSGDFNTGFDYNYDSLVLFLRPDGFEGDSTIAQSFNIYRLTDSIPSNTEFVADTQFPTGALIGTIDNVLPSDDSISVLGSDFPFHIRARLDDGIGQSLLEMLENEEIDSDSSLQAFFRGIYIEPVIGSNARSTYNINMDRFANVRTGISLFYHTDIDTSSYDLSFDPIQGVSATIDGETVFFPGVQNHNRVWTDYSTAETGLQTQLATYNPAGYDEGYVQGGNGILTLIELPDVESTLDGFQINKAEFVIRGIIENPDDSLFLPSLLVLNERFGRDDDGELNGILVSIAGDGDLLEPNRVYDRFASAVPVIETENGEVTYRYTFNLPSYVQNIISGEVQDTLFLSPATRINSFNSLKFGGLNHPTNSSELRVIYTKPN